MKPRLPPELLECCASVVDENLGLHYPEERWADLERGLRAAIKDAKNSDPENAIRRLVEEPLSPSSRNALAEALTVGETYFWREPYTLEAISQRILPELIARRAENGRHLRLWSAGCCTGEEAYTLAIMMDQLLPLRADWRIEILGTDVNPHFLEKARKGVYSEWSFRASPPWLRERYFRPAKKNRVAILPRIREMTRFVQLNLVEPVFPHLENGTAAVDLILCRNVLMYFNPVHAARVVKGLHASLNDRGWLAVSATETSVKSFAPFKTVEFENAFLYQKTSVPVAVEIAHKPVAAPDRPSAPFVAKDRVLAPTQTAARPAKVPPAAAAPSALPDARALFESGDLTGAAAIWAVSPPTEADDFGRLARCLANLGSLEESRSWLVHALANRKTDPELHYLHAVVLEELALPDEAMSALRRVLYLDHDFILAHYSLGNLAARSGRREEATRHFRNALSLLVKMEPDAVVPHSEHLAARRLSALISERQNLKTTA